LGWFFTVKTFFAVGLVSILSDWVPQWIVIDSSIPLFAAVFGGSMMGAGLLMLFRHKASLGGLNILSLYLSKIPQCECRPLSDGGRCSYHYFSYIYCRYMGYHIFCDCRYMHECCIGH
jgi:hypothetical protein